MRMRVLWQVAIRAPAGAGSAAAVGSRDGWEVEI